jgi:carbon starvation protein CstA
MMTASNPPLITLITIESSAAHKYIDILQDVIKRMASNSANCKSLCITLVSAIAVVVTKQRSSYVWITLVPVVLFCFLDAYYLGLEQGFRVTYDEFVRKLQNGVATTQDLFVVIPKEKIKKRQADSSTLLKTKPFDPVEGTRKAMRSVAVYPFYLTLLVLLLLGRFLAS